MVLNTTIAVIFSLYLFITLFGLAIDLQKNSHPFWQVLGHSLAITSFLAIFVYINIGINFNQARLFIVGLFLFFVILQLLPPLFHKNLAAYWQRVKPFDFTNSDANNSNGKPKSIFNDLIFKGVIFLFLFMFINGLGMRYAKNETQFLTLKYNPELIVIRIYGDTIIAKSINLSTKNRFKTPLI